MKNLAVIIEKWCRYCLYNIHVVLFYVQLQYSSMFLRRGIWNGKGYPSTIGRNEARSYTLALQESWFWCHKIEQRISCKASKYFCLSRAINFWMPSNYYYEFPRFNLKSCNSKRKIEYFPTVMNFAAVFSLFYDTNNCFLPFLLVTALEWDTDELTNGIYGPQLCFWYYIYMGFLCKMFNAVIEAYFCIFSCAKMKQIGQANK